MYDHSQEPTITLDLKIKNQFRAVEMVKNLTQTECLAYYTTIMQNQNRNFLNECMTIRKNQLLHWIWKKIIQFKAIEMVKKTT